MKNEIPHALRHNKGPIEKRGSSVRMAHSPNAKPPYNRGMGTMSREATMEDIGQKRRPCKAKDRAGKGRIPDGVCETCVFDRKYTGKLLAGKRIDREPKGCGKHDSKRGSALLKRVWRAGGCMCTKDPKSCIGESLGDLSEAGHAGPAATEEGAPSGASPGSAGRNRRSGRNPRAPSLACVTGEAVPACKLPPGRLQTGTVAPCGGDMHDNSFRILTVTDKKTQWTEMLPVWNRGGGDRARCPGGHPQAPAVQAAGYPLRQRVRVHQRPGEPLSGGVFRRAGSPSPNQNQRRAF